MQFIRRTYGPLLFLFPRNYRQEYGRELQAVFDLSLEDALKSGSLEALHVVLHEMVSLPKAIVLEHVRERRKYTMLKKKIDRLLNFSPGSRSEIMAALAPFLALAALPILFGILGDQLATPFWQIIGPVLDLSVYALIPLLVILGFLTRLPRWSLPYLGLLLPVLAWYAADAIREYRWSIPIPIDRLLSPIPYSWSYLREFVNEGITWGWILLIPLSLLLILFTVLIPGLRPFYWRLRNDWTLLCFMLLGSAPFMAFINFEGYKNYDAFIILMFLSLAVAGWLYLHNANPWAKFLILIGGMTMAMLIAALGQMMLYETSEFQQDMSLSTVKAWLWLFITMVLSVAINLLPRAGHEDEPEVHVLQENV